jgi:glycosyltransferase involved in cell wall biosynthesis
MNETDQIDEIDEIDQIDQTDQTDQRVSIIVPAYNEERAIGEVIKKLTQVMTGTGLPYEIIVVNDGSVDQTAKVAAAQDVRLISHPTNMGYGTALKSGIKEARYEIIVITDADGTYPSEAIPDLLSHIPAHDMVVGARKGENVRFPFLRKPTKWILTRLANYLSGRKIPDLNSGLRAMRKEAILPFSRMLPDGFSFTATITLAMLTNGYRVQYLPINYARREGKSKFRPIHDTWNFFQLVIRTVLYFDPLKIFLPMSAFFLLSGLLLFLYRVLFARLFTVTIIVLFVAGIQLLGLGMIADLINKRLR